MAGLALGTWQRSACYSSARRVAGTRRCCRWRPASSGWRAAGQGGARCGQAFCRLLRFQGANLRARLLLGQPAGER